MNRNLWIESPTDAKLDRLCNELADRAAELDRQQAWPEEQLRLCAEAGLWRWFLSPADGGLGWSEADLMRGYLRLARACLTTTFVITQASGALRRIATSQHDEVRERVLPALLAGDAFTTLGISHLTTSRRHLAEPALRATPEGDGFRLDGYSPWVTGGLYADWIVTGAQLADGRQILTIVPTSAAGVDCDEPTELVALSGSKTGAVQLREVFVDSAWLLAGPVENVLVGAKGASTGGLQTSALAIGLADAAVTLVEAERARRTELDEAAAALRHELGAVMSDLLSLAEGEAVCTSEQLRSRANSLVLRASQAALTAAKGTGFVTGHPAGRWCREALFFLVWSCPAPVVASNLCELAGIES
ncbi:MAG: acyl-CoA dehydrogenase [Planctomycetota bacterium]|nr:MAG: acyl-CoA dehydrogenase [Planctomycetota bacterium]REJ96845.1 MAG: acyl-CoA dehydrogenase [Planctomycetota bacterium]REK24034.1 MAG: acyl-CoA dehydrogenase [Planctomycetota bacterium]REK39365.1 MAG: acyl-CoA dehydrogenase [Planctomycetota bacterium]